MTVQVRYCEFYTLARYSTCSTHASWVTCARTLTATSSRAVRRRCISMAESSRSHCMPRMTGGGRAARRRRSGRRLHADGTSELHAESSRLHAVLYPDVLTRELVQTRCDVVVVECECACVGWQGARRSVYRDPEQQHVKAADGSYAASGAGPSPADQASLL